MYISCPRCDWKPGADARWTCTCKHVWNIFDTHGVCPGCGKIWKMTKCPTRQGCGQWSDHEDWYHEDDAPTVQEYMENPYIIHAPTTVDSTLDSSEG